MRIAVFIGTRAELIGMASFLREVENNTETELIFTHTGQHYDQSMYENVLKNLDLRSPDYSLSFGNMGYNKQISGMINQIDDILEKADPDFVFVQGNVISSFSAAIAASMRFVPVGHIESGYRSLRDLHSDVRRKVIEMCSVLFFPVSRVAYLNLLEECYDPSYVYYLGDPLVDALLHYNKLADEKGLKGVQLPDDRPIVTIAVRLPWNIGTQNALARIVKTAADLEEYNVVMLLHPNTRKHLVKFDLMDELQLLQHVHLIDPLAYTDFLKLMKDSHVIVTDSGGPQKESAILETPCITLSDSTYYIDTIKNGWNRLLGKSPDPDVLVSTIRSITPGRMIKDPLDDGESSKRIVEKVVELFSQGKLNISPQMSKTSFYTHLTAFPEGLMGMRTKATSHADGAVQAMYDEDGDMVLDSGKAHVIRAFGPIETEKET
ncbi:MAG: non-hydrolyzing UDP-N-acetylglucosamine 2-epimerase [Halobacteriota archaeon]